MFDQFERIGSVRQTLLWFHEHGLQLPARRHAARSAGSGRSTRTVYQMLTHPAYGGAYAYGKTERAVRVTTAATRARAIGANPASSGSR